MTTTVINGVATSNKTEPFYKSPIFVAQPLGDTFTPATSSLLQMKALKGQPTKLYLMMCHRAGPTSRVEMSNEELAEGMGLSARQVSRHLQKLREFGLLEVVRSKKGYVNVYHVHKFCIRQAKNSLTEQQQQQQSPKAQAQAQNKVMMMGRETGSSWRDTKPVMNVEPAVRTDLGLDGNGVHSTSQTAVLSGASANSKLIIHDLNHERETRAYAQEQSQFSDKPISQDQTTAKDDAANSQVAQEAAATPTQGGAVDTSKVLALRQQQQLESELIKAGVGAWDAASIAGIGVTEGKGVDWVARLVERAGKPDVKSPVSLIVFLGKQGAEPGEYRVKSSSSSSDCRDWQPAKAADVSSDIGAADNAGRAQRSSTVSGGGGGNKWRGNRRQNANVQPSGGNIDFTKYQQGGKYGDLVYRPPLPLPLIDEQENTNSDESTAAGLEMQPIITLTLTGTDTDMAMGEAVSAVATIDIDVVQEHSQPCCENSTDSYQIIDYEYNPNVTVPSSKEHLEARELQLEPPPPPNLANSPDYSYKNKNERYYQGADNTKVCEPAATPPPPPEADGTDSWKGPATVKCLKLLGESAALVKDIRIGPNWMKVLAVIATFDADSQPSADILSRWKHDILHGFNVELRGKGIKEVETVFLH